MLEEQAFDVIVMDLHLPDSWAPETLEVMLEASLQMPIIFVSGNAANISHIKKKFFMKQALAFVPKEWTLSDHFGDFVVQMAMLIAPQTARQASRKGGLAAVGRSGLWSGE